MTELEQGYLDGYQAALDTVKSIKIHVAPEYDNAIALGLKSAIDILDHNMVVLRESVEESS